MPISVVYARSQESTYTSYSWVLGTFATAAAAATIIVSIYLFSHKTKEKEEEKNERNQQKMVQLSFSQFSQ